MYERYQEGYPLSYMVNEVADLMEETRNPEIDLSKLTDYDNAKEYLSIRLVGIKENEQWLADKVWEPMGDFAKVCYRDFGEQNEGYMTAVVTMGNMALMGTTKEQMMADAQKNLKNKDHVFMSISAMMAEMMVGLQEMAPEEYGPPLYVLTNKEKTQGAAMIARLDIMKEIGDKFGCDYYVLPSSTHEVLVVPVSAGVELEMLSAMVHEVNATEVSPQDKLSDKVQYYGREREQLCRHDGREGGFILEPSRNRRRLKNMTDSCVCCGNYVPEGGLICPLCAVGIIPGVDKKSAIHIFLREYHRGKESAIHSKELQRIFATDGRDIRRKISSLRQDGVPICSDEDGYYYADNQQEINKTVRRLNGMVTGVSSARTRLLFVSLFPATINVDVTICLEDGGGL